MTKEQIKEIILERAGRPDIGWVAENAEWLANEIHKGLNLKTGAPTSTPTPTPAPTPEPVAKPTDISER